MWSLAAKLDHIRPQPIFISPVSWHVSLGRMVLLQYATCPAFGYGQMFTNMIDARCDNVRGLEVSPGSLGQDQLVQRRIRNRTA